METARPADCAMNAQSVFDQIRDFLTRNALGPDPMNYEFAYRVVCNPESALARSVESITDDGVRLTPKDIQALGGHVSTAPVPPQSALMGQMLVAQTQMQVEGFQDLVAAMRTETRDFGRDLALKADAIRSLEPTVSVADIVRLTTTMIERVESAEGQLEAATREASDLRKLLEEARGDAERDPLTGLPNRRVFEQRFAELVAEGASLCIAVCDIDHFKRVNDSFGHAVGDRVLKAIGDALRETCAPHLVARYGGEEFVVLFSDLNLIDARDTLDAARALVASKRYRLRETDAPLGAVTFSSGLTSARAGEAIGDAFIRADRLLYAAKADGRNRIKSD